MVDKIKIRWKEGIGLFIFLIFSGLYFFNDFSISLPGYFAFLDFLNFGDENYWVDLLNAFQEIILPAPILVGVFLYSLYKTEKNIKEGSVVFVKNLERSLIVAVVSSFAWALLTFFSIDYVSYRSDNVIVPLFTSPYFWMIPITPTVLAFLVSFIPSLLLRAFYLNQKKFYATVISFFVFLFLVLFVYQQASLKNCNFNRDEHCLADMAIKTNNLSFCDKAKSDNIKNICLKIIERKKDKSETETNSWKTYRNEEYGIEFKYPIFWGDIVVEDNSVVFSPNDDFFGADIDYKKLLTEKYSLSFSKNKDLEIKITSFSDKKPLRLDCYEGFCGTDNLFDDKAYVEKNYNKKNGELKLFCEEGYFAPGANLFKTCRVYINTNMIELTIGHQLENIMDFYKLEFKNNRVPSFQNVYKKLDGDEKKNFDNGLELFDQILSTFKFTE